MATKNRGHGNGGVDERPDGRLVARIMIDGRRHAHYVKTRQEGYSWLARMRRDHEVGLVAISERQTVGQFMATWLEVIAPTIRATTLKRYGELARIHVLPALGKLQLAKLTPQHLQQLYAQKLADGLSPTTVRHIHVTIHRALKEAMRTGLIQRNVADLTTPPRKARYDVTALTVEQLKTFLVAAKGDRLEALYVLVLTTGMRSGEVLALRWGDVDLTCGMLQVRSSLTRLRGQFSFSEPKSARSRRQVTLTAMAVAALSAHRVRQLEERLALGDAWQDNDLVFPLQDGSPMNGIHLLRYQFHPLLRQAGLPIIRFHDLRHSCATLLLGQGIHPSIVASLLGHSTITVTLDVYSHVTPTMQRAATEAMDRLLGS